MYQSNFRITDEVTFRPMYKQQVDLGIADEELEGKITAVKFTEAKVFYDVYSPYWGKVFENVDSVKVYAKRVSDVVEFPPQFV